MVSSLDYDQYLARRAASLIRENFAERGVTNLLVVKWGNKWSRTLGHIKPLNKDKEYGSEIDINSIFKSTEIPEYVLNYVLMHELAHYFQGFGSNHERKARHPHRGGLVDKELDRLGWSEIRKKAETWLKEHWKEMLEKNNLSIYTTPRKRKLFDFTRLFS